MLGTLKHDKREIFRAAADARKICDLSLSYHPLLLFVFSLYVLDGNRARQAEIQARQADIDRAQTMQQFTFAIAQALGEVAVKYDDDDIRELLRAEAMPNWRDALKKSSAKDGSDKPPAKPGRGGR